MEVEPGYKQTEVGVLPEDWGVKTLGEIATFRTGPFGTALHKSDYTQDGVPVINPMHLIDGSIEPTQTMTITEQAAKGLSEFRMSPGEIVMGRRGDMGRCAVVRATHQGWLCGTGSVLIRPRLADPHFLQRVLSSPEAIASIVEASVGTTMVNLNHTTLSGLLLQYPDLNEQRAIASALSDVDGLLGALDRLIAKKRDLKQAAMQQLLTGQTRLPGFTGEWKRTTLGDVIDRCSSGATPYRGRPEYYKGTIKWISSGELNYNVIYDTIEHISQEAVRKTNLAVHPPGTFLMAITGLEAAGTRGAGGIGGSPATTNQSCMAIYPTDKLITEYLFHYYVLRGNELAFNYCQGTKQQSYTAKLVKILPIDLPPTTEEQSAIAKVLRDMDAELAALEQRRDTTRAIKQGMMQELLTGRTRLL